MHIANGVMRGHCRFVHGYDRSVHLVFECSELDDKMWVMDFGGLKPIKAWLEDLFDHTLLINEDDPELEFFQEMEKRDLCRLRVMPNVGMEGSAKYVFEYIDQWVKKRPGTVFPFIPWNAGKTRKIPPSSSVLRPQLVKNRIRNLFMDQLFEAVESLMN